MKKTLLKTMLLLCALVVGGSAWAQSDYSAVYTSNVTLPQSGTNVTSCKVKINNVEYNGVKLGKSGAGASASITAPAGTKYIHLHVAAWKGKTPGFKYKVGTATEQSITITSDAGISDNSPFTFSGNPSSSDYYKVITLDNALTIDKTITFTSTSERAVFWGVNTEEEAAAPNYTITANSNDASWGTVSLSGNTITATPATGYRVSTTTPYTVSPEGSATVEQDGNTFTVTPSANTTVTINFEAIPNHTVSFSVNGTTISTATVAEGAAITFPSAPADVNGMTFVGWYTSTYDNASVAPEFVTSATMGNVNVTYYAVFANVEGSIIWQRMAASSSIGAGTYALLTNENHAFNGVISSGHGQSTNEAFTFVNGEATSAPEGICEIELVAVSGGYKMYNSNFGYLYAKNNSSGNLAWHNTENSYWLYESDNWKYKSNGAYLRSYNNTFRTYGSNSNSVVAFAKKVNRQTYSNYCTTVPEPAITLSTNSVEATAAGAEGTINVTYTAIDFTNDPEVVWYTDATATTTANEPSWLAVDINSNGLEYIIDSNEGAARTAYLKVYALDVNGEDVYSELITVTQAAFTQAITPAYTMTTYVTPYKMDFTGVDGLKAYVATNAYADGVTVTEVTAAVPENTPLLLKGTAGTTYNVPVAASATAPATNKLRAGDGTTVFDGSTYDYLLYSDGKFYQIGSGTIATNKAYLHLESDPAGARALDIIFDGAEASSISDAVKSVEKNEGYFDLQGRRVAQPTKGLYIVNGKKVIVK